MVLELSGFASFGIENTGNPERFREVLEEVCASPFLAHSEITAPAEDLLAPATSFATARIESSISRVVLIVLHQSI
jgi:hypothetical protein